MILVLLTGIGFVGMISDEAPLFYIHLQEIFHLNIIANLDGLICLAFA